MQHLSALISNYNVERFFADPTASGLSLHWSDIDRVLEDDRTVNRGSALCTGDVVVFLDSDDSLQPDPPERVAGISGSLVRDAVISPFHPGPERWVHRIVVGAWCLLTMVAAHRIPKQLSGWRCRRRSKAAPSWDRS